MLVELERLVAVEAELEQDLDPARLVGGVADLEDDVGDVDRARQRDRLRVRDEMDFLLAVRLGEDEPFRPRERRTLHEPAALEHDRGAGARVEAGDDDPGRRPHRMGDERVQADAPDAVEPVGAEPGEDVGEPRRDAAARDDATAGRLGGGIAIELFEGLGVVRAEIDEVDAGGDGRVGDADVVAHVRRVEHDLGVGERRRQRRRVLDVDPDDPFRRAEVAEQDARGFGPEVADGDLVVGPLDEVGDGRRPHLTGTAEDEDPGHLPGDRFGQDPPNSISWGARSCWPGRRRRSPGSTRRRPGTRSPRPPRRTRPRRSRRRARLPRAGC